MSTSTAPPSAAPAGPAPGVPAGAPPARRRGVDRLTVLNWLAFLAILGMTLGEGCAMQAAKRREARQAGAERRRALDALEAARAGCDPAAWGVGLVTGAPAATGAQAAACAAAGVVR